MQRGEQHGVDGDQDERGHADGENHLDQRERLFVVGANLHFVKFIVVIPGWVASVFSFTE